VWFHIIETRTSCETQTSLISRHNFIIHVEELRELSNVASSVHQKKMRDIHSWEAEPFKSVLENKAFKGIIKSVSTLHDKSLSIFNLLLKYLLPRKPLHPPTITFLSVVNEKKNDKIRRTPSNIFQSTAIYEKMNFFKMLNHHLA
jgi:hypothetical protein